MPDVGATVPKPKKAADTLSGSSGSVLPPKQTDPEMQAAIDQAAKDLATPKAAPVLTGSQAGALGLAGADTHVNPTDTEIAVATTPVDPVTSRGYADPGLSMHDIQPPINLPPDVVEPPKIVTPATKLPVVAKQEPTIKDMLVNIMNSGGNPSGTVKPKDSAAGPNWGEMLAGLGGKAGDFLQRWGLGLQGKGEAPTQGDIKRAQQFELTKQKASQEYNTQAQAVEQKYALDRMNIQNQLNMANLPVEKKAELENALALVEANRKADLSKLNAQINLYYQKAGMSPGADPGVDWGS
jgi:hypothetical protein